ncbi:DUF4148 domain-containing protein [Noviherbaspirillum galbum]|uniref:DUF4148 domain-containing protein n=1 Tax=Noviherbaspirillum galbum TaxID=2709383 RepID=A0A6B3SZX8_9BURK|nr:DUF4148 domain-containing protein [Noviherbaspirillum galbum]NEX64889.1 DUF4148 domain-containing protein [Noviherbaspirillum galbum]
MKTSRILFAAAVAALSSSAIAGTNTNYPWSEPSLDSSKTRTEVRSELESAYREGTLVRGADYNYPAMSAKAGNRTSKEAPHVPQKAARQNESNVFMYGA